MAEATQQLFEISWEVCNKVGGIHTVLSSKAKTAVERWGDDYLLVGPQLQAGAGAQTAFDDEPGYEPFQESCRRLGLPVRVGRWRVPGRPRCLLVGFSSLYAQKDGILAGLWERHQVDSIAGSWDYTEPVLFATAAAMVIERWWEDHLAPFHRRAVVQAHEWMTGASLLYLQGRIPSIGTVFTTHATVLGRAMASLGVLPQPGLGGKTPSELAEAHGVRAKHSLEASSARQADVFTTVSPLTADECGLLLGRRPDVLVPNGLDLEVVGQLAAGDRGATRRQIVAFASAFLGEDVGDAVLLTLAGRYEFHNKGIELLLDALAVVARNPGRRLVALLLVPAGNSGVRSELRDRLDAGRNGGDPLGICTHNLFDEERDPVQQQCRRLGLENQRGSRVKVVHVPVYLRPDDGVFGREYEAVLAALDLGVYPSFYEPWGYTPQEALAVGLPTITTDLAGFGRWAAHAGLGPQDGITVLARHKVPYAEVKAALAGSIESHVAAGQDAGRGARSQAAVGRTAWRDLYVHYEQAHSLALAAVQQRSERGVVQYRLPRRAVPPAGAGTAPRLSAFEAAAVVPERLRALDRLGRNFWWSWNPGVRELFLALTPDLDVDSVGAVRCLQHASLASLERLANDREYLGKLQRAVQRFDAYLAAGPAPIPLGEGAVISSEHPIAYFSAEFGVHASLPIYSGGLGVLAGDHLKSASDLGLPLVGVGLFYRFGYLAQQLSSDGQQLASERENDPRQLAVELLRNADGQPLEVTVPLPGRDLALRAFKVQVGRVPLYLLDANVPQNRPEDRDLTRRLYGGEAETRIQQEILLGRGGVRLLRALGLRPSVFHMNEGHAAFLTIERLSLLMKGEGQVFEAAREYIAQTTLFTTHTPVPAGHDRFGEDLLRRYFGDAEGWVGLPWDRFLELGRAGSAPEFNMTWLALGFARFVNGVSLLHGQVSRQLLLPFWPGLLAPEVPVTSITNGVHLASWTHRELADLLRQGDEPVRPADFAAAARLQPAELWRVHERAKADMLDVVRAAMTRSFLARGDSPLMLSTILGELDARALYLGFARRFAPYKRAQLLFSDIERLRRILADADRPVRILVAGKAHPRDGQGQELIQRLVQLARSPALAGKVVFVEDYDVTIARALVQGVDVWLNTPTRMQEASGTSGMKAAANGVLNLSIADGWWPEAADGRNGWTIGGGQVYSDAELQNQADATALYGLLEEEIVPLFFDRDGSGLPRRWLERMLHCLGTVPSHFNTDRMLQEYQRRAYEPLARNYFAQQAAKKAPARELGREIVRVRKGFQQLRIAAANTVELSEFKVGQHLEVGIDVDLGPLGRDDVLAELVVERQGDMPAEVVVVPLAPVGEVRGSVQSYAGGTRIERAGRYSYGLRARGRAGGEPLRGLVTWA